MADINLQDLALAMALSGGLAHPYGHVQAGKDVGTDISIDWSNRVENWQNSGIPRKEARINAGGFAGQDLLAEMLGGDYRKGAGIYKLGYLSGLTLPKAPSGQKIDGDIDSIKELTGNKYYGHMLLADALSDMFFDSNKQSISTKVTESGTPVMLYNRRF